MIENGVTSKGLEHVHQRFFKFGAERFEVDMQRARADALMTQEES